MALSIDDLPPQRGLLDLSVDLSVPDVHSGTDFTVYLHIKNPFAIPVWVRKVELSLPTQLAWRDADSDDDDGERKAALRNIEDRNKRIRRLKAELRQLPDDETGRARRATIADLIADLDAENEEDRRQLLPDSSALVEAGDSAVVNIRVPRLSDMRLMAKGASTVNVDVLGTEETERVPLVGSLPRNTALQSGCTDVWTIRLGTGKNWFFQPAKYHLQLTVIYETQPPSTDGERWPPPDAESTAIGSLGPVFSNTTSFDVGIKAALWNVMRGGVIGGAIGSAARSLQDAKTITALVDAAHRGPALGALMLAVILSGAAIVFAARKSDAQSFVTVEDFWGGLLIGFLIGYSGTAAFSEITGIKA